MGFNLGGLDNIPTWLWAIILGVIVYFMFFRKKKGGGGK